MLSQSVSHPPSFFFWKKSGFLLSLFPWLEIRVFLSPTPVLMTPVHYFLTAVTSFADRDRHSMKCRSKWVHPCHSICWQRQVYEEEKRQRSHGFTSHRILHQTFLVLQQQATEEHETPDGLSVHKKREKAREKFQDFRQNKAIHSTAEYDEETTAGMTTSSCDVKNH